MEQISIGNGMEATIENFLESFAIQYTAGRELWAGITQSLSYNQHHADATTQGKEQEAQILGVQRSMMMDKASCLHNMHGTFPIGYDR
jgi:hypothetical protein